jgi:hypothetical protein
MAAMQESRAHRSGVARVTRVVGVLWSCLAGLSLIGCSIEPTPLPSGGAAPTTAAAPQLTAAPVPQPGIEATLQAEYDNLKSGRMLFNPPVEMTVGQSEVIEVRIQPNAVALTGTLLPPTPVITEDLLGSGTPTVEPLEKVGRYMRVALKGDDGAFDIRLLNADEEQFVPDNTVTSWKWSVTPHVSGEHALHVVATVILGKATGLPETSEVEVQSKRIRVAVNPGLAAQTFLGQYGGWLILGAALVIAFSAAGAWLARRGRLRALQPDALDPRLSALHRQICRSFSEEELQILCLDFGLRYDQLEGRGMIAKVHDLVLYAQRTGRLGDLVALCRRDRPGQTWDDLRDE